MGTSVKAAIHKYVEAWNTGDVQLAKECVSPGAEVRLRGGTGPTRSHGPEHVESMMRNWQTGFPDFRYTVAYQVGDGDRVMAHFYFTGTHQGEFQSGTRILPPTGKQINIAEFFSFRVSEGKIVDIIACWDRLKFWDQLGFRT